MRPCSYTYRAIADHYGGFPQSCRIPHKIGSKKRRNSIFSYSVTIHLSIFTATIHPLLFMTLFTPNFAYLRGVVPYVLGVLEATF